MIRVNGTYFVPGGSYKCGFGSLPISAVQVSPTEIQCECPPVDHLGIFNFTVLRDSIQYFPNSLPFHYYGKTQSSFLLLPLV